MACLISGLSLAAVPEGFRATAAPLPGSPGREPIAQPATRPGTSLTLTAQDNGRTVVLRRGEILRVVLSANAGTGYSWQLDQLSPRLLEPLAIEVRPAPGLPQSDGSAVPLAGGPQQVTVLLRALNAGRGTVGLKFWRGWEGESSVVDRFRVTVVVVMP